MHAAALTIAPPPDHDFGARCLLTLPEALRVEFFESVNPQRQKEFGQFLTPPHVANLMAAMFGIRSCRVRLLDAGAGMGILSAAFVQRQLDRKMPPKRIEVTAYEMDSDLIPSLKRTYEACRIACERRGVMFSVTIRNADFITEAVNMLRSDLFSRTPPVFDAAIVNPPYGKLSTASDAYRRLQSVRAETTNLYAAFLSLIVSLLRCKGELVAITPRSFCNGPYFRAFRRRILGEMSVRAIHVFESRTAAFKHDRVLQENVILHAVKDVRDPLSIRISQNNGEPNDKIRGRTFPVAEIISPGDTEAFIHIPTSEQHITARSRVCALEASLDQLDLTVSTGRVVDFRTRQYIRQQPEPGGCPLIYPCHFNGLYVTWPAVRGRKPNAIHEDDAIRNLLIPAGVYVLIKRFTSKEERRRVVACIYDPSRIASERVGLENHLNYIHAAGKGLDMLMAKGLWAYLNSSVLDLYFRQFNGHTQVNATDLRNMKFPTACQLRAMGGRIGEDDLDQRGVDDIVAREIGV